MTASLSRMTVWTTTTFDGYPVVFVWRGGSVVNVYTGLDRDGDDLFLDDVVNFDAFTVYAAGGTATDLTLVQTAIEDYMVIYDNGRRPQQ